MNAKQEFINVVQTTGSVVIAACLAYFDNEGDSRTFMFGVGDNYQDFMNRLNFDYDSENGTQQLYGVVWFSDGSWAERETEGDEEFWVHRKAPTIPARLQY